MTLTSYLKNRRLHEAAMSFFVLLLFGLVNATSVIIENVRGGYPSRWVQALGSELSGTLVILVLIPPVLWFLRTLKLDWSNVRWRVLWHVPAFICFSLAHITLFVLVRKLLWASAGATYVFGPLQIALLYEMRKGLLAYIGLVLVIHSYQFILDRLQGEADFVGLEVDDSHTFKDQFLVKMLNKQFLVKADSIDWVQSASNYVVLYCGNRSYPMRQTLSGLAEQLNPEQFLRVHRTAIVNVARVVALQESGELQLELVSGVVVPVSKTYLPALKQALQGSTLRTV